MGGRGHQVTGPARALAVLSCLPAGTVTAHATEETAVQGRLLAGRGVLAPLPAFTPAGTVPPGGSTALAPIPDDALHLVVCAGRGNVGQRYRVSFIRTRQ